MAYGLAALSRPNVNEAKTNFSSVISNVETNPVAGTIMRNWRPIVRIAPIKPKSRRHASLNRQQRGAPEREREDDQHEGRIRTCAFHFKARARFPS